MSGETYQVRGIVFDILPILQHCQHVLLCSHHTTPMCPPRDLRCCFVHARANFIVIVPGANYHLSPEDVVAAGAKLKGAKVMLVRT